MSILEDEIFTARPATWVRKPRGIPHCFWNAIATTARILEVISPSGLEGPAG